MTLDFLAIVSWGLYPTPTPNNAIRSQLFASWGLFGTMSYVSTILGLNRLGLGLRLDG